MSADQKGRLTPRRLFLARIWEVVVGDIEPGAELKFLQPARKKALMEIQSINRERGADFSIGIPSERCRHSTYTWDRGSNYTIFPKNPNTKHRTQATGLKFK